MKKAKCEHCDNVQDYNFKHCQKCLEEMPSIEYEDIAEEKIIDELLKGVNFIGEITYGNFIKTFDVSEDKFKNATKLESLIYVLFLFDYVLVAKQVPQDLRQNFYEKCTANLIENFTDKLENKDLMNIIDHRYTSYGKVASRASSQGEFLEGINNMLILQLESTEDENEIKKGYPLRINSDPIKKWLIARPQFIATEMNNPYRIVIIIDKLLDGKNLSEAISDIKKLEKK